MSPGRNQTPEDVPIKKSSRLVLHGLTIRSKLLLFTVSTGCLILSGLAITTLFLSTLALRNSRLAGLNSLRTSLARAVDTFVTNEKGELATQSEMQTFRYAMTELSYGYQHLFEDLEIAGFHPDSAFLADIKQQLQAEYQNGIMANLQRIKGPVGGFDRFAELSSEGFLLQYVYILKASSETGARLAEHALSEIAANQNLPSSFRMAFIRTTFARAMDRYHNLFEAIVRRNNYLDFLLIDDKGNVIYSFDKSWDFGTNVLTGWRAASNLNRVFSKALFVPMSDRNTIDQVVTTDMERYPAGHGAPMMFLGCPINNRLGGRLGVLVQKIPSSVFTDLVSFEGHWVEVGLGKTGEAYLVGPDRKLRTEPRFRELMQNDMKSPSFSQEGQPLPATAILTSPLKNAAIENVFSSNGPDSGAITFFDELGRQSLGVYTGIIVSGLKWGLVITINTDEAFAPAAHLTWLILLCGLVTIFVAVIGSLLFGHFLSLPIAQLVSAAEKISSGDNTARAQVSSQDEIGFLAERFNRMIDRVEERNRHVHKILETVSEALFLLDRNFVIQPGYSRMTREIFRRDISGKNFLDLLRPDPNLLPVIPEYTLVATQSYLELLLNPKIKEKLIQQTNPLSEIEFQYVNSAGLQCSKFLDFRFNRIMDQGKTTQIMVTTVDSTSRISLKKEIRENEAKAEYQITTLFGIMHVDPALLLHFLDNTKDEILGILGMLEEEQFGSNATETSAQRSERYLRLVKRISRSIHLIKGNAAMLRLSYFENLANQLEEKLSVVRGSSSALGESFLPITTGLASFLDRVRMTRELVERLSSMHGSSQAKDVEHDFSPLVNLAYEIAQRNQKSVHVDLEVRDSLLKLPSHLKEPIQLMLTQLVRNAIVHGIEPPLERVACGKSSVGQIQLSAFSEGKVIMLKVRDDGRGIDHELLRKRAIDMGYVKTNGGNDWSNDQLEALIFETGFTTLEKPTTDGGHGVGLDAVRDLIARLGGHVSLTSSPGCFCEFSLKIPFT